MNTYKLSNVSLALFRKYLKEQGCELEATKGGHEKWKKDGCLRSVIIQTHVDPLPEFILKNNLRTLDVSRTDFINWLKAQ